LWAAYRVLHRIACRIVRSLRPGAAALAGREAKPLPLPYNPLINVFEIDL
jgi:hypothetical protein